MNTSKQIDKIISSLSDNNMKYSIALEKYGETRWCSCIKYTAKDEVAILFIREFSTFNNTGEKDYVMTWQHK